MKKSELRKLIREEIQKVREEKLSPERQKELDELIDDYKYSTDPSNYDPYLQPEEVIASIRTKFGDVIADQVADGDYHFPRQDKYQQYGRTDHLKDRQDWIKPARITKQGKMNKNDQERRTRYWKNERDSRERFERSYPAQMKRKPKLP